MNTLRSLWTSPAGIGKAGGMKKPISFLAAAPAVFTPLIYRRYLIWQIVKRDVSTRYKGSVFGLMWSFFQPLLMLAVYSLVFGIVFRARWPELADTQNESGIGFAVVLFAGLILHAFMAECLSKSPGLIINNANYVKKLVFPLEILSWSMVGNALIHALISFCILLVFSFIAFGKVNLTIFYLPLVVAPFVILMVGIGWFLSAVGVFFRDIEQVIGVLVTILLFTSPILFPIDALPEGMRSLIYINPLTIIVQETRSVVLWGHAPEWGLIGGYLIISIIFAWASRYIFERLRRAFADVL